MRQRSVLAGLFLVSAAPWLEACSPKDPSASMPPVATPGDASTQGVDAGPLFVANDGAAPDADISPAPLVGLRLANWSADAPAIDFCLAPHGIPVWQGPLLAQRLAAVEAHSGVTDVDEASTTGIPFPQVSAYLYVQPGQYDARVVAAGSPDCTVGVLSPDDKNLVTTGPGTMATVALMGDATSEAQSMPIVINSYLDDWSAYFGDSGLLSAPTRFINASPSTPSITFGTGSFSTSSFAQFFVGVPFGEAGNAAEAMATEIIPPFTTYDVDANGYLDVQTIMGEEVSVHAFKGRTDLADSPAVTVPPGIVATMVAVGDSPVQIVQCLDNVGAGEILGACSIVSQ